MNERASCTICVHRRAITSKTPNYTVCHYLIDTGETRGCSPVACSHWQSEVKNAEQWIKLLERIKEADNFGG